MQKKSRFLFFIPIILLALIICLSTCTVAFAEDLSQKNNYKPMFPYEDSIVKLGKPTSFATYASSVAIYDDQNKTIKISDNFNKPINLEKTIATGSITNLQMSKNIVAYFFENKINLYNKKNNENITNKFNEYLTKNSTQNNFISDFYLTDNTICFIGDNNKLYSVNYDENFVLSNFLIVCTNDLFFNASDLSIINDVISFSKDGKKLYKISKDNKILSTIDFTDNIAYSNNYTIRYNKSNLSFIDIKNVEQSKVDNIKNKEITATQFGVGEINQVKINGNNLLICDSKTKVIAVYDIIELINGKIKVVKSYGISGDFLDKLSSPSAVKYYNNNTYVLDNNNGKLKNINTLANYNIDNIADATDFAILDNTIYYYASGKLNVASNDSSKNYSIECAKVDKIEIFKNNILLLSEKNLYTLDNKQLVKLSNSNVVDFAVNKDGDFVYIYDGENINKYLNSEKIYQINIGTFTTNDFAINHNFVDFEIDNNGNIFILDSSNQLTFIKNDYNDYSNFSHIKLSNDNMPISKLVDLEIAGNKLLFVDNITSIVYEIDDKITNKISQSEKSKINITTPYLNNEMTLYKANKDGLLYTYQNNFENACKISSGDYVWAFNELTLDNKLMVLSGDKIGFVYGDMLDTLPKQNTKFNALTKGTCELFTYPSTNAVALTLNKGTKVKVLSTTEFVSPEGFSFYEVEFDNHRYFAVTNDFIEDTSNENKIDTTMITKAKKIGEKVKMYKFADSKSEVLLSIKDGETVKVIDKIDGFYKVKYGSYTGYIMQGDLIKNGLTNNQIVAIIVASITFVVAVIIFVSTMIIRNKRKPN